MESRRQESFDPLSLIALGVALSIAFNASLDRNPLPYVVSVICVGLIPVILLAYTWVTYQIELTWTDAVLTILIQWIAIGVITFVMSLGLSSFNLLAGLFIVLLIGLLIKLPPRRRG